MLAVMGTLFDLDAGIATVSELTALIKATLEIGFDDLVVRGEVSGVSRPRSGHIYLNLKDDAACLRSVLWKPTAQRLPFDLQDGLAVRAWGRISVYAPRGDYQLIIDRLEPEGIGALELAFRQMFARLAAEGLFDPDRKRPLPEFPRRIAVVSSPTGAAVRDFLQVVARRWSASDILIVPARVQGQGAAEEVADAIALANRVAGVDLVVLARGGGSLEDLWAFNEEVVARAIVASRVPVVSAIGHEVDVTIADHAADFRALTPSEAGERCVPDEREVRARLDRLRASLARALRDRAADARYRLDDLSARADRAIKGAVEGRRSRLARLAASLEALSPVRVLARGYSLTTRERDGALIRDAAQLRRGERIVTRLGSGHVVSRVEEVKGSP
jgi:exodeoxyribonuclease VII large subunit